MRIVGSTFTGVIVLACLIAVSSAAARSGAGDAGQTAAGYPRRDRRAWALGGDG